MSSSSYIAGCVEVPNIQCAGYLPEKDKSGKEVWPRGDEHAWKEGMRGTKKGGMSYMHHVCAWI